MMKRFSWLLLGGLLALGYGFVRENPKQTLLAVFHRLPQADSGKSESAETEPQPAPPPTPPPMINVVSPLASWMGKDEPEQPRQEHSAPRKPHPLDHIAGSPVGSTNTILHRTFAVSRLIKVPFEIPAHAATPHLHGTFRSSRRERSPATTARTWTFSSSTNSNIANWRMDAPAKPYFQPTQRMTRK
jgi:hypothetical protein